MITATNKEQEALKGMADSKGMTLLVFVLDRNLLEMYEQVSKPGTVEETEQLRGAINAVCAVRATITGRKASLREIALALHTNSNGHSA